MFFVAVVAVDKHLWTRSKRLNTVDGKHPKQPPQMSKTLKIIRINYLSLNRCFCWTDFWLPFLPCMENPHILHKSDISYQIVISSQCQPTPNKKVWGPNLMAWQRFRNIHQIRRLKLTHDSVNRVRRVYIYVFLTRKILGKFQILWDEQCYYRNTYKHWTVVPSQFWMSYFWLLVLSFRATSPEELHVNKRVVQAWPLPQNTHLNDVQTYTLQGINISHLGKRKIIFKMSFFGDMLVPWRVYIFFWWGGEVCLVNDRSSHRCSKTPTSTGVPTACCGIVEGRRDCARLSRALMLLIQTSSWYKLIFLPPVLSTVSPLKQHCLP